jgi:hypothetical protein
MYEGLLPAAFDDETQNWALLHFCEAFIGSMQLVEDLIRDDQTIDAPGWSIVLDVDRAPYYGLPWLGQFVGVTTPALMIGETEAAHDARVRDYIRAVGGFDRGKPSSVVGAVQQFLTGTKEVILYERDTSPYHFDIRTRETETPVEEWATTNFCRNGGAETNTTGWSLSVGTSLTRDSTYSRSGSWAFKLVTAGGVNDAAAYLSGVSEYATGEVVTISAYVRPDVTVTLDLQANELDGASALLRSSTGSAQVCPAGVFTRLTHTVTLGASTLRLQAYVTTSGVQPATSIWFDDVQIEKKPAATPYVHTDGAQASRAAGMANIRKAINAQKPAGLQFTYQIVPGWTYDDLDAGYATYNAIDAAFTTYDDIDSNNP